MVSEVIAAASLLSAAVFAAGWLKARVRTAECLREHEELANSSRTIEFEKRLLELMARGLSLHQLLDSVTGAIEAMAPECVCTVLLLDEERRLSLLSASGPSLPPEYMRALSGLEIGPEVGACGSAAFLNETVIVENIATDYRFALAKDFVLSFGLRSCWSVPIRNFSGVVQGTFAMYHREPARPRPAELRLVEAGARLAGNVIERLRSEQRMRETAERLDLAEKAAEFGIWEVRVSSGAVVFSEGFATLVGLPAATRQLTLRELDTMLYPGDRAGVRAAAAEALDTGTFHAEFRIILPDRSIRWERGQGRIEPMEGGAKRAVGALIDINDEKDLLMRLEEARTAAEASARVAQQAERLELDRKNVLELVAKDQPLEQIARAMALAVSRQMPLSACSIQMELPGDRRISAAPLVPEKTCERPGTDSNCVRPRNPFRGAACGTIRRCGMASVHGEYGRRCPSELPGGPDSAEQSGCRHDRGHAARGETRDRRGRRIAGIVGAICGPCDRAARIVRTVVFSGAVRRINNTPQPGLAL
ncbi:MAG TPA: GAF domain-containing protein [Bryobacteraceae bacterium]|nr:GAF domain-containing protein [Bryobacteraceae bacterium]